MFKIPKIEREIRRRKLIEVMQGLAGWSKPDIEVEIDPEAADRCAESSITPSVDIAIDSDYKDYQIKLYQAMMNAAAKKVAEDVAVVHEVDQYEELKRKWTDATLQIKRKK